MSMYWVSVICSFRRRRFLYTTLQMADSVGNQSHRPSRIWDLAKGEEVGESSSYVMRKWGYIGELNHC